MDERELVRRILQGDERAKTEFYRLHQQKLYAFCVYFMGADDPEIEDILQEAFLAAFQKLSQFEFRSSLDTWLTQICIHQCYRHFRKRSRWVAQEDDDLEGLLSPQALEEARRKDRARELEDKWAILEKCLGQMGGDCRDILLLRLKEGASYIEIARSGKIPVGTVMSRLARCTAALKKLVERRLRKGLG